MLQKAEGELSQLVQGSRLLCDIPCLKDSEVLRYRLKHTFTDQQRAIRNRITNPYRLKDKRDVDEYRYAIIRFYQLKTEAQELLDERIQPSIYDKAMIRMGFALHTIIESPPMLQRYKPQEVQRLLESPET